MCLCEYRFENFNARGYDEYLAEFAQRLDQLFAEGWILLNTQRDAAFKGWWQVELHKSGVSRLDDARVRI